MREPLDEDGVIYDPKDVCVKELVDGRLWATLGEDG